MVGLGGYLVAGALQGAGSGIIEEAKQLREDRLLELQNARELQKENRARDFQTSEREASQQFTADQNRLAREAGIESARASARKPTDDMREYQMYVDQERAAGREPMNLRDYLMDIKKAGAASTSVTVGGSKFGEQMDKNLADSLVDQRSQARDAANLIGVIHDGRALLDNGAITGAGADYKVQAIKLAKTLGVPIPQDAANNTEAFKAVMGNAVGMIIKQFGSGSGLSDADRQYAERIVGGDVSLNEEAIRRIFDIAENGARGRINDWNEIVPKLQSGDLGDVLNVEMPSAYRQTPRKSSALPEGVTEDDVQFTMRKYGLTRDQVIERLNDAN